MVGARFEGPVDIEVAVRFGLARKEEGSGSDERCILTSCSSVRLPPW